MSQPNTTSPSPSAKWNERQSLQVGELLVRRGLMTSEQLAQAIEVRTSQFGNKPLMEVFVEMKLASRTDVLSAIAATVGVPYIVVVERMVRPEAVQQLTHDFCDQNNVLPLTFTDGWLTVAAADFTNIFLIEQIKQLSGVQVQLLAADADNIRQVRGEVFRKLGSGAQTTQDRNGDVSSLDQIGLDELTVISTNTKPAEDESRDLEAAASGSPIIRLVNHIIKVAVDSKASDIHIEPAEREFQIRYRIDGELTCETMRPPINLLRAVVSRIKIMAAMDISERRLPQDGGITVGLGSKSVELRVSTMATTFGEKVVIRIVDNSNGIRNLESLGFSAKILAGFRRAVHSPNGIILVTGPTGSGKSTTLYSALTELASPKINISSVEDPVECHLPGINQFQANSKTGFTFARALRSMLRQDPDVIMVGEIRDTETAKLAVEAALTGHVVLSTLHTNDAPSAVPRLVNMGVEPYLVAASVRGVLAQRLVKRLCVHCRKRVPVRSSFRQLFSEHPVLAEVQTVFQGAGCARCRDSGFAGRTCISEMMVTDEEMLQHISRNLDLQTIRRTALERGMTPLLHDFAEKLKSGVVGLDAIDDVLGHCDVADHPAIEASEAA